MEVITERRKRGRPRRFAVGGDDSRGKVMVVLPGLVLHRVVELARRDGMSISGYIRKLVLTHLRGVEDRERVKHEVEARQTRAIRRGKPVADVQGE